jgi:hypothetical protein
MELEKYYALYSDKEQTKLLSLASSIEKVRIETEYHSAGVWFEYDQKPGSNFLFNERILQGIEFPKEPKKREYGSHFDSPTKPNFKWVS